MKICEMTVRSTPKMLLDRRDKAVVLAFSRRLRELRRAMSYRRGNGKVLTRAEMADLLGVEHERYRRWERGDIEPPLHILVKVRLVCGVSLDRMIAGADVGRSNMVSTAGLAEGELTLGDRLWRARELAEPDLAKAAAVMGVPAQLWAEWEASGEQPPIAKMQEFAHRFGVTLDYLYSGRIDGLAPVVMTELLRRHPELAPRYHPASQPAPEQDDHGAGKSTATVYGSKRPPKG